MIFSTEFSQLQLKYVDDYINGSIPIGNPTIQIKPKLLFLLFPLFLYFYYSLIINHLYKSIS